MSMPGYTRLKATEFGEGAQETWLTAISRHQDSGSQRAGRVIQTFDRTAYLEFDAEGQHRPNVMVLGTETVRQGPLLVSTNAGPATSFSNLVEPKSRCKIRKTAGESKGHVLSVGPVLEIEIADDLISPSSTSPEIIHSIRSIETGCPVWQRGHTILQQAQAEMEDGIGWLDALERTVDDSTDSSSKLFQKVVEFWTTLLNRENIEEIDINPLIELVGRGPGATPSGDDILSGILFTLIYITEGTDRQIVQDTADRVLQQSKTATTTMSLALLEQAAQGRAPATVDNCLKAILDPQNSTDYQEAATEMAEIGHHSGPDALAGMLTVLLVIAPAVR